MPKASIKISGQKRRYAEDVRKGGGSVKNMLQDAVVNKVKENAGNFVDGAWNLARSYWSGSAADKQEIQDAVVQAAVPDDLKGNDQGESWYDYAKKRGNALWSYVPEEYQSSISTVAGVGAGAAVAGVGACAGIKKMCNNSDSFMCRMAKKGCGLFGMGGDTALKTESMGNVEGLQSETTLSNVPVNMANEPEIAVQQIINSSRKRQPKKAPRRPFTKKPARRSGGRRRR